MKKEIKQLPIEEYDFAISQPTEITGFRDGRVDYERQLQKLQSTLQQLANLDLTGQITQISKLIQNDPNSFMLFAPKDVYDQIVSFNSDIVIDPADEIKFLSILQLAFEGSSFQ